MSNTKCLIYCLMTYVIFIIFLIVVKPTFIYDHQNDEYIKINNTIPTIVLMGVLMAVLIYLFYSRSRARII